jgi:hypothetical protein
MTAALQAERQAWQEYVDQVMSRCNVRDQYGKISGTREVGPDATSAQLFATWKNARDALFDERRRG